MSIIHTYKTLKLSCLLLIMAGCATTGGLFGPKEPSPTSLGIAALLGKLEDSKASTKTRVEAAKELTNRKLSEEDARRLVQTLHLQMPEQVELAVLDVIEQKDGRFLAPELIEFFPKASGPSSAIATVLLLVEFIEDDAVLNSFMENKVLPSAFPMPRARAARYLSLLGDQYEASLLKALEKETHANAALVICEALVNLNSKEGLLQMERITNDLTITHKPGPALDDVKEIITTEKLRIYCVKAVEESR